MKTKKRRKVKWKSVFFLLLINIFFIATIISGINILKWKKESNHTTTKIVEIQEITAVETVEDSENTEVIEIVEEIPEENPYWDYIKMNLIDVDFKELKEINSDTVGWIQLNGTNINYPFVQTTDNEYYLTRSFDKKKNNAGWVFMDYRNSKDSLDRNTILYAHGRKDNTMFGTLKNILSSKWINNADNYIVKMSTETENSLWQVFSIYNIPETTDYLQTAFYSNTEFLEFGNMLINRSEYNFNTTINENDKILTFSTCYNKTNRIVLHAKLIKLENKNR